MRRQLRRIFWWFVLLAGVAAGADPEAGRKQFAACLACHTPGQTGPAGPDLRGVVGRTAGTLPGFHFSRALKKSKIVWSAATLDAYLADPQAAVPGNVMPFPGLPDAQARADLVAYLETLRRE